MLDECYRAEDDRFLEHFVQFEKYELLRAFVGQWLKDPRPWAREQMQEYLRLELNFPGHEVVVKRLFKHFEAAADLQMLPHFLVSFDRLVRRQRQTRFQYDPQTRNTWYEEALYAQPNKTIRNETGRKAEYFYLGVKRTYPLPDRWNRPGNRLFSHLTRNYLRRRVWRFFRRLAHHDAEAYVRSISAALALYQDDDFREGENILDNWSLMHACYFHHDAITFTAAHTNVRPGRSLGELTARPYRPEVWQTEAGGERLIWLIQHAQSSLVRLWAMELIRTDNKEAIGRIDIVQLIDLLSHVDPRVQEFASELFKHHPGLAKLKVSQWLELIGRAGPTVLPILCDAMSEHVTPDRLDVDQLIQLACAKPSPVSRMGVGLLMSRHKANSLRPDQLSRVAEAECQATTHELTEWALQQITAAEAYSASRVIPFFDSLNAVMRVTAMDWLLKPDSAGYNDPVMWAWLVESPFDDVKLRLVDSLAKRDQLPGSSTDSLVPVWVAVILGVHRGGRAKLKAVRQIADAVAANAGSREQLLPVLAVALRSIRGPEQRAAISALTTLLVQHPQLRPLIAEQAPELQWSDPVAEEAS